MNTKVILSVAIMTVFMLGYYGASSVAFAQPYLGNIGPDGETGQNTVEEHIKLNQAMMEIVKANPSTGSGTPYLDLDGVVGASIISAAIFGGIAGTFFVRARSGRYAAMGRG